MSYCVNCGVELDRSAKVCPLCNTPVINPNELLRKEQKTPFPQEKGQVETVNKKDMGILMTVLVIAAAVTCGLLNAFVFTGPKWSLAVIGVCAILWVIMIPVVIYTRLSIYLYFLLDGMVVGIYLYMLTFLTRESAWFWGLGLPLVGLVTFLVEELTVCIRKLPRSFLTVALYLITNIGLLCMGIEILIDKYLQDEISLSWSAVVLTVCVIMDIAIVTMLSRRRLRNAVRRRLHF